MPRTSLKRIALLMLSGLICCELLAGDATGHPAVAAATETSSLLRQVSPQTTDPAIDAWLEPHLAAFDPTAPRQARLFIFFSGSYGQPENQRLILEQAARAGYHAIGLLSSFLSSPTRPFLLDDILTVHRWRIVIPRRT
jgi:hypothetical protein